MKNRDAVTFARNLIARELRQLRRSAGMTLAETSANARMSPERLDTIERAKNSPSVQTVKRILCALGEPVRDVWDLPPPKESPWNKRIAQKTRADSWASKLRIWESKNKTGPGASLLLKCGCCHEKLRLTFHEHGLEINDVFTDWDEWLDLLWLLRDRVRASIRLYRKAVREHRATAWKHRARKQGDCRRG